MRPRRSINPAKGVVIEAIEPRLLMSTYYISPSGNDSASGLSATAPWKSPSKINSLDLNAGDEVLLQGGATFSAANLTLDAADSGSAANPVTIGSYGTGRAILDAGNGTAIAATNLAGLVIRDLKLTGSWNSSTGSGASTGRGIYLINNNTSGARLSFIRVDNVEATGFRSGGISITCGSSKIGFDDVRITNAVAHDNGSIGIVVDGYFQTGTTAYANSNVYIGSCQAYNNTGIPTATSHSGDGIVVSDTDGGTIERCLAWNNGQFCNSTAGGPVGIWAWDANNVTIQFNESYGNKTGSVSKDGGGFDLDGGMTNSVMQYNYSHDNAGAGFLLYQFTGARPFGNNVLRCNISQNDGRSHDYAGIYLGGGSGVTGNEIYNNTIYITPSGNSSIAALRLETIGIGNAIRNNLLYSTGGVKLLSSDAAASTANVLFQGNDYFPGGGSFAIKWGTTTYSSLTAWRATGEEKSGSTATGQSVDPQLVNPGGGATVGDATRLQTLAAYELLATSPLINTGMDLAALGINTGGRDYFAQALPSGAYDVGAFEWSSSFTAASTDDAITLHRNPNGTTDLLVNSSSPTLSWTDAVYPSYSVSGGGGEDQLTFNGGAASAVSAASFSSIEKFVFDQGNYALASPLNLHRIAVTGSATLDLRANSITDTADGIGSWNGSAYTGLTGLIQAGRITAALGVGIAQGAGSVTIRAARPGDANLDGFINGDDYYAIDSHSGTVGGAGGYASGDFDYNGRVNADDYFLIDANYAKAQPAASAVLPAAVVFEPPQATVYRRLTATS